MNFKSILIVIIFITGALLQSNAQLGKISTGKTPSASIMQTSDAVFLGYNIYRNDTKINSDLITDPYFTDIVPENGSYDYYVTAVYEEGESNGSNTVNAVIDTTKAIREYVVTEKGTGTWCGYCPGAALGFEDLLENGKKILPIAYHNNDSYVTGDGNSRLSFYSVSAYPTTFFDGLHKYEGGSQSSSLYDAFLPYYEKRKALPTSFKLLAEGTYSGNEYSVNIKSMRTSDYNSANLKLITVITEDHIAENWMGLDELNAVVRKMVPNASGTPLDFSSATQIDTDLTFTYNDEWVKENTTFIAFIQDMSTKEILQATKLDITEFTALKNEQKAATMSTLFAPFNLASEYSFTSKEIKLSWSTPGSERWQQWDNGQNSDAVGSGSAALQFDVASRWTTADLTSLNGMSITRMAFFPNEASCNYNLKIWTGINAADIILDSALTNLDIQQWNEIILKDTIRIDVTKELWLGYFNENTQNKYSAGCDAGPSVKEKGGKIRIYTNDNPGTWDNISAFGLDVNWNIKFFVEPTITTGIKSNNHVEFDIFPNPAKNSFRVSLQNEADELYIIGVNGQVILHKTNIDKNANINISGINSGVYFVKVISNNSYSFEKLVIE